MKYGRYQVIESLGEGTSGVLYKAYDPIIDRHVALKVLRQNLVENNEFLTRFIKEAKAVGRLSDRGIVTVYDIGEDQGTVYIAMELIHGAPLDAELKNRTFTLKEILEFGTAVALSLGRAHSEGVIHRDIKPQNILFTSDGDPKITDFGIARIEEAGEAQRTQVGTVLGTPLYMSPEQINGQPVDGRSDLYSLSVLLYEMVSGRCPFTGTDFTSLFHAITQKEPEPLSSSDTSLSDAQRRAFFEVIYQGLAKKCEERFQTGAEMVSALKSVMNAVEKNIVPEPERPQQPPLSTQAGKRRLPLIAILLAAAIIIGAGVFFFLPESGQQVMLQSEPSGARIFIDGTFKGETPLALKLPAGKYEVKLTADKYFDWEAQIEVEKGKEQDISIPLLPFE